MIRNKNSIRHNEIVENRKRRLISIGICHVCGNRKINYARSNGECSKCLDKAKKKRNIYYSSKDKKKIQASQRASILKNPDVYKKIRHKYYENHKDDYFRYSKERRGRVLQAEGSFTKDEWKKLLKKFGNKCLWCGATKDLEPDHVVAISKGGSNSISNIQPLCRSCNSKKHTKTIDFRSFGSSIMEWT